ncbi:MAG: hypothetical protein ACUVR3_02740 [Candidatus Roseilinea sp.]|uniref:hypothetical protein n=1 Tax=Candidatus Roseilinea sp. TaxID=2838777 RepID=UPI00404AF983
MARFLLGLVTGAIVGIAGFIAVNAARPPDLPPDSPVSGRPLAEIHIEQTLLNEQLAAAADMFQPFSDVRAEMRPPSEVVLTGKYTIDNPLPIAIYPRVTVKVGAHAGRLTLYVSQIDIGNINIPRAMVDSLISSIEQQAASSLNEWIAGGISDSQMNVRAVRMSDAYLIVELSR